MTTGRINQVAAMRAPTPIGGRRRAIDEITKLDRLACFHSFIHGQTDDNRIRAKRRREAAQTHAFSVRLSSTRCGVEMSKTVECLA